MLNKLTIIWTRTAFSLFVFKKHCLHFAEGIVLSEPMMQGVALKKNNWSRAELYDNAVKRGLKMNELARRHGWGRDEISMASG